MIDFAHCILVPPQFITACNQNTTAAILLSLVWLEASRNTNGYCKLTVAEYMVRTGLSEKAVRQNLNALIKARLVLQKAKDSIELAPNRQALFKVEVVDVWDDDEGTIADRMAELQKKKDGAVDPQFMSGGKDLNMIASLVRVHGEDAVFDAWRRYLCHKDEWCRGHPLHLFVKHFVKFFKADNGKKMAKVDSLLKERVRNGRKASL